MLKVLSTPIFEVIHVKKCDMGVEEDVVSLAEEQWSQFWECWRVDMSVMVSSLKRNL